MKSKYLRLRMKNTVIFFTTASILLSSSLVADPLNIDAGFNNGEVVQIGPAQRFESESGCSSAGWTVLSAGTNSFCFGYQLQQEASNVANFGF